MILAAQAILVNAACVEHRAVKRIVAIGLGMAAQRFCSHFAEADSFDRGRGAGEIALDELGIQANRIKDLRPAIGLVGRNAHLGHDLENALAHGFDVVLARLGSGELRVASTAQVVQRLKRDIGIDRLGTIARQSAEMMDFARLAGLDHEASLHAQALAD